MVEVLCLLREITVAPDSKVTVEKRCYGRLSPDGNFQPVWLEENTIAEPITTTEPDMSDVINMVNKNSHKRQNEHGVA